MSIERPVVSQNSILAAAQEIFIMVDGDGCAEDIANCYYGHIDGYELAKKLEQEHNWDISAHMVEDLDCMHNAVSTIHKKECLKWVIDSNIKPQFENGTKIKQGIIKGVYEHDAAMYTVTKYGETMKNRHLLIKFEDAAEV